MCGVIGFAGDRHRSDLGLVAAELRVARFESITVD
jgi:hypothetical protein